MGVHVSKHLPDNRNIVLDKNVMEIEKSPTNTKESEDAYQYKG